MTTESKYAKKPWSIYVPDNMANRPCMGMGELIHCAPQLTFGRTIKVYDTVLTQTQGSSYPNKKVKGNLSYEGTIIDEYPLYFLVEVETAPGYEPYIMTLSKADIFCKNLVVE